MNNEQMKAAADRVSALVAEMRDPEEVAQVTAFVQGLLAGSMHKIRAEGHPLKIADVRQDVDASGTYENHFTVVTESGIRIRVEVTPEEDQ